MTRLNKNSDDLISTEQIENLRIIIEKYRPRYGTYEREQLLPQIIGRLKHTLDLCTKLRGLCNNEKVAHDIDFALQKLLSTGYGQIQLPKKDPGKEYLKIVGVQLEQDFIAPLNSLLASFGKKRADYEIEELIGLVNRVSYFFQMFVGLKEVLFHYSIGAFVTAKMPDGTYVVAPPMELDVVLIPFKTTVEELKKVGETTIETIEHWGKHIREAKSQFMELAIRTVEGNTAKTELSAANRGLVIQVLIALTALLLIALGYFGNLLLENRTLLRDLDKDNVQIKQLSESITSKDSEIKRLKDQLTDGESKNNAKK